MKVKKLFGVIACFLAPVAALADSSSSASVASYSSAAAVPELDGSFALLAAGLTVAVVAIIRERRARK